jgi:hypothetical protein
MVWPAHGVRRENFEALTFLWHLFSPIVVRSSGDAGALFSLATGWQDSFRDCTKLV